MPDLHPRSFLLATFEGGGSVTPMLCLAERLMRRGHRVRLMSDACNRGECEAAGATFVPWTRAPSKPQRDRAFDTFNDWDTPTPQQGFMNLMDAVLTGPARAYAEDVIEELQRAPADLVVSSEMLFGVHLGCEAIGQKLALLAVNIALFPVPGIPPLGPGLPPARNAEDRALHDAITTDTHEMLDRALPGMNAARAALGLGPLGRLVDQHGAAVCLMLATARAFDFAPPTLPTLPTPISYVGPLLGEPKWAESWASPFSIDDRRPLALVSFSTTFQDHAGVLQHMIDAIAGLPMNAVVTLGGAIRRAELRDTANVAVVESAPHNLVMAGCSLVVTHGGHGTVMKALAQGKPMLIVPHGRDQLDNAVRVTERGAGLMVPRTSAVTEFRAAIARLLHEPAFTTAARDLGAQVAREAADSPIVDMIERMAAPCDRARGRPAGASLPPHSAAPSSPAPAVELHPS